MDSLKTIIDTAEMSLHLKAYITHNATGSLSHISGFDVIVLIFIVLHTFTSYQLKNQIVSLT